MRLNDIIRHVVTLSDELLNDPPKVGDTQGLISYCAALRSCLELLIELIELNEPGVGAAIVAARRTQKDKSADEEADALQDFTVTIPLHAAILPKSEVPSEDVEIEDYPVKHKQKKRLGKIIPQERILKILEENDWNKAAAAKQLQVRTDTLGEYVRRKWPERTGEMPPQFKRSERGIR